MYLPPNYMNYGAQPIGYGYVQPQRFIAQPVYAPYPGAPLPIAQPPRPNRFRYCLHPLGLLRFLLILILIGVVTAASLVRNSHFAITNESGIDKSVWISTLVFGCVGLVTSMLIFLAYLSKCVWLPACRLLPWTLLFGLFDLAWSIPLIILGSFCAWREHTNQVIGGDFRNRRINKGAFGVTAAMALLAGVLFFLSALLHFFFGAKFLKEKKAQVAAEQQMGRRL